jgi:hypothetical protein
MNYRSVVAHGSAHLVENQHEATTALATITDHLLPGRWLESRPVTAKEIRATVPVHIYGNMTDDDLKAVFAFLKTLPPVQHRVDNTEAPAACKICGRDHGLGAG